VIRAVVDTNVFVSGLLAPLGNEALIVLAIQQGLIKPYFSAEMLEEYAEVLARPKFSFPPDEIESLIALVRSRGEQVSHPETLSLHSPDPADDKFITCAVTAAADFIVTGNKRDFPLEVCGNVRVVSAGELLERITLEM
jgi:putative PIN family toxin of toxin-antitoxin system